MVQLIRSNIQNYRFYVETFSQALDFWFQHLKGVHFGKNDTRISFLVVINECITMKKVRGIHLISGELKITPKEIQAILSVENDSALWSKGAIVVIVECHNSNNGISMVVTECHLTCVRLTIGMVHVYGLLLSICFEKQLWKASLLVFMIILINSCKSLLEIYFILLSSFISLLSFS